MSQVDGSRKFTEWFQRLFTENTMSEKATRTFHDHPRLTFVSYDTVKTMHQILNVRESYGITFQDFFAMCQRAGREQVRADASISLSV